MKNNLPKGFIFLLILFSIACSKDSDEIKNTIELKISVPENGGVELSGNYSGTDISSTGFYLSETENFESSNADKVGANKAKSFKSILSSGLKYNQEYFVRAFVRRVDGKILESEEKSFISLGSKAPVINEIPDQAHLKETITITGKNFNDSGNNSLKVYFDQAEATILSSNDTLIKCIVPTGFERHNPDIKIKVNDKQTSFQNFSLFKPEISNAPDAQHNLGDTVTLYGNHFDNSINRTKILVDNKELRILQASRDSIRLILPFDASSSTLKITLYAQKQTVEINSIGKFKKPIISAIKGDFRTRDTISLIGSNFSPVKSANHIYFDNHKAEIIESNSSKILLRIPLGPYKDWKPKVSLELLDYIIEPNEQKYFTDHWLYKAGTDFGFFGNSDQNFSIDGKLYLAQKDYGEFEITFLEFDSQTYDFNKFKIKLPKTNLADFPFQIVQDKVTNKVYILFNSDKDNFYELNITSQSFKVLPDYPGLATNFPEVFITNNTLFVTGGWMDIYSINDENYDKINELWAYDLSSKTWGEKASFPVKSLKSGNIMFQQDDDSYISYGINTTGGVDFWKYSKDSDSWTNLNSNESARFGNAFFTYEGKGYAYFADPVNATPSNFAYRYNFNDNSWNSIQPLNNRYFTYFTFPDRYAAFKVGEKIFIGILDENLKFFEADLDRISGQ